MNSTLRHNFFFAATIGTLIAAAFPVLLWTLALGGAERSDAGSLGNKDFRLPAGDGADAPLPQQSSWSKAQPQDGSPPSPPPVPQGASVSSAAVSWEEYAAAVNATVACFQEAGLKMRTMPHPDASGLVLRYTVWLTGDEGEDARIASVTQECEDRHLTQIERARAEQFRPSERQLAAARAAMAGCLIAAGVPAEHVDQARLLDAQAVSPGTAYPDCANSVAREYGIPSFGG